MNQELFEKYSRKIDDYFDSVTKDQFRKDASKAGIELVERATDS